MKLLVCGGAGFIGSNFIRRLLARPEAVEVVNFDKLTYAGNPDNLRPVENDPRYSFIRSSLPSRILSRGRPRGGGTRRGCRSRRARWGG